MATTPAYIGTPRIGFGEITTGQAARTTGTTTSLVDVITGAASGTRILEIVVQGLGDPADSTITLWLNNGTSNILFDDLDIGNPAAASNTTAGYRLSTTYNNLVLPNASWKVVAGCTVTPTSGNIIVWALGGDI